MLVEVEECTDVGVSCFGVNQRILEHFYNTGNDKKQHIQLKYCKSSRNYSIISAFLTAIDGIRMLSLKSNETTTFLWEYFAGCLRKTTFVQFF